MKEQRDSWSGPSIRKTQKRKKKIKIQVTPEMLKKFEDSLNK